MSMIGWVLGVSLAQSAALRATPSLVADLVACAENDAQESAQRQRLAQLPPEEQAKIEARWKAATEQLRQLKNEADAHLAESRTRIASIRPFETALDLEKSWHILHFLFTGQVWSGDPPANGLLSGEELGDDLGYGAPRLLGMDATAAFAGFLQAQKLDQLQGHIDYRKMVEAQVYGMPMGGGDETEFTRELRAEVATYFPLLHDYVVAMAAKRNELLLWIS